MSSKMIGAVLGDRYKITELVGSGGMAVVYKAEDLLANRMVALKVLKEEFVNDVRSRRRFVNESRAIAMLSHANIVDVFDFNFDGETQYIVMELVRGVTLKKYLTSVGKLSVNEAMIYAKQILSALQHAHDRGVFHRDIKPQNILLMADATIKVADFGIARISNFETMTMTMSDKAIGSVYYMSPEQARGLPIGPQADIYSVGVMLYEMMTGILPFDGDTPVEVALQQVQVNPAKPREHNPDIPVALEEIILRAMSKNLDIRYSTADEMIRDMDKFMKNPSIVFGYDLSDKDVTMTMTVDRVVVENKKRRRKKMSETKRAAINHTISMMMGFILSLALVGLGTLAMLMFVQQTGVQTVKLTSQIGKSITEVSQDREFIDNFKITAKYVYSDDYAEGIIISQSPKTGTVEIGKEVTFTVSKGQKTTTIPYIVGIEEAQALVRIKEANLLFSKQYEYSSSVKEGRVIRIDPSEGAVVSQNTKVSIVISLGPQTSYVYVPSLVGKTKAVAEQLLLARNLNVKYTYEYSATVPQGMVISQSIEPEVEVATGTAVSIAISMGPELVTFYIPNLIGSTKEEAEIILAENGLSMTVTYRESTEFPENTVISQDPVPGTLTATTESVTVVLARPY